MPIWAPPTPPQDENDVYIDHSIGLLYDSSVMMESELPPVYIKKEPKKIKVDHVRKHLKPHQPKGNDTQSSHGTQHTIAPPQSLFNRPSAALLRMRREAKQQKLRAMAGKQVVKPMPIVHRPSTSVESHSADRPDWLINEDWALLQAVQALQELPLTLQAVVPGHIINWDLVSDVVNACGHTYRSPKQCRNRYEGVIIPREEGKILYDTNPKKQKKSKGIYRTKSNRPMKTSQLHAQDGNNTHTHLYNNKFDLIKAAVSKKQPHLKQVLNNPLLKNPKHCAVLNDFGIGYDKPMSPVQVAAKRAERIAREKKAQQEQQQQRLQAAAAAKQQQQQQAAAAIAQAVATATTATVMTSGPTSRTTLGPGSLTLTSTTNSAASGLVISSPRIVSAVRGKDLKQSGPITRTTLGPGTTPIRTVNSAAAAASSIVVNTPPGSVSTVTGHTFASINKRMSQGVATIATVTGTGNAQVTPTVASSLAQVVRAQQQAGTRTSVVTLPSNAGIITSQVRGITTATVVMTTSAATVQARPTATLTGTTSSSASTKNLTWQLSPIQIGAQLKNLTQLTPAQIGQLALFKQQALRQQQLHQQQQQTSQLKQGKTPSPAFRLQQLKQADLKRLQAQAAQQGKPASPAFRLQQLKQADLKRLQQAQAQAQAAQVQAQAQAQAAQQQPQQQQVTAQTLQTVQKGGVATVVGTSASGGTVISAAHASLTAAQRQQVVKAVQQQKTTLARQTTTTLKDSEVAALIKLQQQRVAQQKLKGTITTLPVSGVKVSTVPMQSVVNTQGQKVGQATPMKALTIQPGKLSLQQIIQMQQAQKVQAAQQQQQKLLGVKAQLLQKQVQQVQQVVTSGGTIRVSSPHVVVTSSVSGQQQVVQSSAVQSAGTTLHQVQGLQVSQAQLAQGVRLQQVTSAQGGTPTVQVQRVTQVPQMTTVRQQLQQQVKQAAAAQGTTLSIQQGVKPVTLIQSGASLLPGTSTKTATVTQAQLLQQKQMLQQIVTSVAQQQQQQQQHQQQRQTTVTSVPMSQLARVVAATPAAQTIQTVQVSQPQQTLTVESVARAPSVVQQQHKPDVVVATETVPQLTSTVKSATSQSIVVAHTPQTQINVTSQPGQAAQSAATTLARTVTAAQLQQAQAALRQQQQQQQSAEANAAGSSSQRTSPYAMRLRKPSNPSEK